MKQYIEYFDYDLTRLANLHLDGFAKIDSLENFFTYLYTVLYIYIHIHIYTYV